MAQELLNSQLANTAIGLGLLQRPSDWGSMTPERLQEFMDDVRTAIANSNLVDAKALNELVDSGGNQCAAVRIERGKICFKCEYGMAKKCLLRPSEKFERMTGGLHTECPKNKWLVKWTPVEDVIEPHSETLVITVGTGDLYHELLDITAPLMRDYADRIGADFVELRNETQQWWGLEKFRVHEFSKQYGRVIYLDADVIVLPRARDLFEYVGSECVGAHDDYPYFHDYRFTHEERREMFSSQGVEVIERDVWINAGIVVSSRQHSHIWSPPPEPFQPTHCSEQLWVEQAVLSEPYEQLPTDLNCQYWIKGFFDRVRNAEIIHLSACSDGEERVKMARKFAQW